MREKINWQVKWIEPYTYWAYYSSNQHLMVYSFFEPGKNIDSGTSISSIFPLLISNPDGEPNRLPYAKRFVEQDF